MNEKILILEDEDRVLFTLVKELSKEFEVESALSIKHFSKMLKEFEPDILVMDIRLPDGNSLDFIKKNKLNEKNYSIVLISGYPEEEYLLEGLRLKVDDFIKKPFNAQELKYVIKKIVKDKNIKSANQILSGKSDNKLVYKSDKMKNILERAKKFSHTDEPVLITGESGTGKQLMANFIHLNSPRKENTFLDVNCAAISETLLESQLFGHKKGAFTDAREDFKGFFELTDGGTLFLDEISEMKPELQAKLLKVVENKEFMPLGSNRKVSVDVRIITATNRNFDEYIKEGKFRHDLYYRLNVFNIDIPPLRERTEDIPLLVEYFIDQSNKRLNRNIEGVSEKVMKSYLEYNWPGNIRELKNIVHRAVLLNEGEIINKSFLSNDNTEKNFNSIDIDEQDFSLDKVVENLETEFIIKALEKSGGSQSGAAKILGITRDKLKYRIKNYNIKI